MKHENPFDLQVKEYEEWFKMNDKLYESELDAIKKLMPKDKKGIEIGVGTGLFASKLNVQYGLEPSEKMAEIAKQRGIDVKIGNAENIPFDNEVFDYALMITADCFLEDVSKSFKEIFRILKKDGILIVAFLDRQTPLGKIYEEKKHLSKVYCDAKFHSESEISIFLKESGFKIESMIQTIFTLENIHQAIKPDSGEGIFCVIKASKKPCI